MPGRVLIVDEDALARQTIGAWLENKGYVADFARDMEEVFPLADEKNYDYVIADIEWPDRQGTDRIARLRERFPAARIIAMSAYTDFELEQEARQLGAYNCMTKPLERESLISILDSASPQGGNIQREGFLPGRLIGQMLLRGFTPEQQWEFRMSGLLRTFAKGEVIEFGEDVSMVWVEKGRLEERYGEASTEILEEGDFWGEETLVIPSTPFTHLVALEDSQLRLFERKKLIEFFTYQDESLTKRYMINLIHCLHLKWRKSVARLGRSGGEFIQKEE